MQIELLYPQQRAIALEDLQRLVVRSAAEPFHKSILDAVVDFSHRIYHGLETSRHPELLALAHWMRKTELTRLTAQFRSLQLADRVLLPRGLVFHLPPTNVDTMFVYSWLLAALTGNSNIIRLSPVRSDSTNILLRVFGETLAEAGELVSRSTVIVSYGHEKEPTEVLSALCDVRVIWGGDQTVEIIRRAPLGPYAKEITFPDRYSMSAISAEAYTCLAEEERDHLAEQFFNDSYLFDQLACSSPRLVVWCGADDDTHAASTDFFSRLAGCVERHQYVLAPASSIQKLVYACSAIISSPVRECRRYKGLTVLTLDSLAGFQRSHPGGGLFFEVHLKNLVDLSCILDRRDQTLTWFGFPPEDLYALVDRLNGRAIDRIVPIGQALRFHRFWDGYDLLQEFCRCVHVISAPGLGPRTRRGAAASLVNSAV